MGLVRLVSYHSRRTSWIVNLDNYYIMPVVIRNGIQYNVRPTTKGSITLDNSDLSVYKLK